MLQSVGVKEGSQLSVLYSIIAPAAAIPTERAVAESAELRRLVAGYREETRSECRNLEERARMDRQVIRFS